MSATPNTLLWNGSPVVVEAGDTIATALIRARVLDLGTGPSSSHGRYFCGSGACQNCVVRVEGLGRVEACLTPAAPGMVVWGRGEEHDE